MFYIKIWKFTFILTKCNCYFCNKFSQCGMWNKDYIAPVFQWVNIDLFTHTNLRHWFLVFDFNSFNSYLSFHNLFSLYLARPQTHLLWHYVHRSVYIRDMYKYERENERTDLLYIYPIYPTPPLGQDITQGQFFKQSLTGLNSELSFS